MKSSTALFNSRGRAVALGVTLVIHVVVAAGIIWGGWMETTQSSGSNPEPREVLMDVDMSDALHSRPIAAATQAQQKTSINPAPTGQIMPELVELAGLASQVVSREGNNGAGLTSGNHRNKVRFIRLRYAGGDWDQDLDLNSDHNMLVWYAANTGHEIAAKPEVLTHGQLGRLPIGKSPPMVYMTGQKNISLSLSEVEVMREYLTDKRGMLFADNGGSSAWHSQFFGLMSKVLPDVEPIRVPLDHPIHRSVPFVPIVAPHGGRIAYGWVIDSRLAVYYHPGDIGDAWADGHAGVPESVYEACYRLGGNVMLYSHTDYSKWLQTRKKKDGK